MGRWAERQALFQQEAERVAHARDSQVKDLQAQLNRLDLQASELQQQADHVQQQRLRSEGDISAMHAQVAALQEERNNIRRERHSIVEELKATKQDAVSANERLQQACLFIHLPGFGIWQLSVAGRPVSLIVALSLITLRSSINFIFLYSPHMRLQACKEGVVARQEHAATIAKLQLHMAAATGESSP